LDGSNYINSDFVAELRERKPTIKLMPRFICSEFKLNDFTEWLKEKGIEQFLKVLIRRVKFNKLDGIVFECNQIWLMEDLYANFTNLLKKMYEGLKELKKTLIITALPHSESVKTHLTKLRFEYILKYTDYINIMAYDHFSYYK
jgi:GH18 family chitinase